MSECITLPEPSRRSALPSPAIVKPGIFVVDLRQPFDFARSHLPGAVNLPFAAPFAPSPFFEPSLLASLWTRFEAALSSPPPALQKAKEEKNRVLLVCYDGDSARVASSVLRAKGWTADSTRGGFGGLEAVLRERGIAMASAEAGPERVPEDESAKKSAATSTPASSRSSSELKQPRLITSSLQGDTATKAKKRVLARTWMRRMSRTTEA